MDVADLHPLLELVSDGPLPCRLSLCESNGSTKGTSSSTVPHTGNTDVVDTSDGSFTRHTSGHLDLHVELGAGGER
jgi:hypothetical protein